MSKEITERIKIIIDHYELAVSTFADSIGVQRSSISHLLNGRNKPSLDFILKVIKTYPEVNLYWLLNGKGTFPAVQKDENISPIQKEALQYNKQLPKEVFPISTNKTKDATPSKIVIFYTDGTFESYEVKND
ncbi:helix-turn-helix domain-containing protein [Flagellimonas sp. HMM57]|uniref:helix-turn-helix transcriptional regulator n=1 Tax=unclassified Flagellimonas TaxID=2644544 RepID=UPI0013D2CCCD|nr:MULTISPECIES: helix-turn-helix transcriptional regulator [unclassified Flagellimonas]UII75941.1 helix-turn-helix domain-containing protein [Flagellimonas sp. HMM57]